MSQIAQSHRVGQQNPVTLTMRDFGIQCLSKIKHGAVKSYTSDRLGNWKIGTEKFLLRVDASNKDRFAWTNISPLVVRKLQEQGVKFAFLKRNTKVNELVIYEFSPQIIMQYYEQAGIRLNGHGAWTIRVLHTNENTLVFKRVGAKDVVVPCDADNSFNVFKLSEDESQEIISAISRKAPSTRTASQQTAQSMKAYVKTGKNMIKFNGTTPRAIAIMGVLAKANMPLRVDDVISGMLDFGALPIKKNEKLEVSGILQKMLKTGTVFHPDVPAGKHKYILSDDVTVNVMF